MALTQVTGPYPIFTDLDGTPLDDGYLYIGLINQDPEQNPIQVFWDANLTIPASQPIRTSNGYAYRNGTPALLYTGGEFSITIRNKREEFVLYSPVGYGFDPAAVSASVVKNDFVGDGVTDTFTLSASPSTKLATSVFINGVYQEKDSYSISGNTIIFSVAPPLSSSIEVMSNETGVIGTTNASLVSYTLTASGAIGQTVQDKLEQIVSVNDFGAVGDCVPGGPGGTTGTDDTVAFTNAINAYWTAWSSYIEIVPTLGSAAYAISGPVLTCDGDKNYLITDDLPALPPGAIVNMQGASVTAGAHGIRIFHTDGGGVTLPNFDGSGNLTVYGSVQMQWDLPIINCNQYCGPFVVLDTVQHGQFGPMKFFNSSGIGYTISGALATNSRFVGVTPTDYAKVRKGDVLNLGDVDQWGNPKTYLVCDKRVENSGATDRTYGKLKLDSTWTGATGNTNITPHAFAMVTMKLQQSGWSGRREFIGCNWSVYHGRNADEITSGGLWTDETVLAAYGFNDQQYGEHFEEGNEYGVVFGPWSADFNVPWMSLQFNTIGSHLFVNCIDAQFGDLRFENDPAMTSGLKSIPCIVVGNNSKLNVNRIRMNWSGIGRYISGQGTDALVQISCWDMFTVNVPQMPDSSYAPFVKNDVSGFLNVCNATGMTGPNTANMNYIDDPKRWCTDGAGGGPLFGYSGARLNGLNNVFYANGGETRGIPQNTFSYVYTVQFNSEAYPRWAVNGQAAVFAGTGAAAPVQILTTQQAAVPDATGAGDVVLRLNELLSRIRLHGLIAT
jgi:hypothetical protein